MKQKQKKVGRKYKVYTLWGLIIPLKQLAKASISEKNNIFLSWMGRAKKYIIRDFYVDSLNEADWIRSELVPKEDIRESRKEAIESLRCLPMNSEYMVILSQGLMMELRVEKDSLYIETRQYPKIISVPEDMQHVKHEIMEVKPIQWEYESTMVRKSAERYEVYCPLCEEWFLGSSYLKTIFKDERELWLANMVTHYRHSHITSWNKMWGRYGWRYQEKAHYHDDEYEERKSEVNERAKRQIVRKAKQFILDNNINSAVFSALQGTTQKTLQVVDKIWI